MVEIDSGNKIRGAWTPEEDDMLVKRVDQHGARDCPLIATGIPGRSGKSCRLRWCNQLNPADHHRSFTPADDAVILQAHAVYGNKWSIISRMLPGRTDNAIKNHWNSALKRRRIAPEGQNPVEAAISRGSNSAVKRSLIDVLSDSTESDSGMKRQCSGDLQDHSSCDGPVTLLTLFPPSENSVVEEKWVEEKVSKDGYDQERSTVKGEVGERGLVTVMKRMISEEVRSYIDSLRAKQVIGLELEQPLGKERAHEICSRITNRILVFNLYIFSSARNIKEVYKIMI